MKKIKMFIKSVMNSIVNSKRKCKRILLMNVNLVRKLNEWN